MFKQVVGAFATTLMFALLLLLAGGLLRWRGRTRLGGALLLVAIIGLYLCATGPVANAILRPLESRYPALGDEARPDIRYVVVLGSGYAPRPGAPVTAALEADGLARIIEGIRLLRQASSAQLIVSGGAAEPRLASARGYARLAQSLGVEPARIIQLAVPRDTAEEAEQLAPLVGRQPFILVTSAYHMPRAMRLMQRAGLHPMPAPTAQLVLGGTGLAAWLPRAGNLGKTDRALHEYLGLAAQR